MASVVSWGGIHPTEVVPFGWGYKQGFLSILRTFSKVPRVSSTLPFKWENTALSSSQVTVLGLTEHGKEHLFFELKYQYKQLSW